MISFFVPGNPKGKGRPRFGNGRTYTDKATAEAEASVAWHASIAHRGVYFEGPLHVIIEARFGVPPSWSDKKRQAAFEKPHVCTGRIDCDNIAKLVCDGLNRVIWQDDRQIVRLEISKVYAKHPGVHVEIREVE
jgi:Holliday junction resolvase RusA-like endonuclease